MKKTQTGFTLIELIVVIVILGILAATALPKFADLQVQARQAKLQGAIGSVKGAVALFHAQCLARVNSGGTCPADGSTFNVTMEGLNVNGVNQYPDATATGIVSAAGLTANTTAGAGVDYVYAAGTNQITISVPSPTANSCQFVYNEATAAGGALTSPPTIPAATTVLTCN